MIKRMYLSALTLITIGCVIYGTSRIWGGVSVGDKVTNVEESALLDKYTQLDIDMDVSDVNVVRGTEYKLDYSGTDNLEFSYKVDNGVLKITQKQKVIVFGNSGASLTLTVPQDAVLERADITSDVGDIRIEEMDVDTYISDADVGDTKIYRSSIKNIELESNTGDVTITECELGRADIQSDVGEVKVEKGNFENLDIESDVGDVVIESEKSLETYGFDLETDVGNVEINNNEMGKSYDTGNSDRKIKVTGNVGDIKVTYQ